MNILMPTDFSENSWNAISYALSFFQNVYTNFYFLNIETNDWEETDVKVAQSTATNTQQSFQVLLTRLAKEKKNNKHQFFTATESGNFIEAIREQVTNKEVDFIVMGTQGASGYKEATVGSHSTDVITRVKCPVLVIPEDARYTEPKRITFPTDFNISYKNKVIHTLKQVCHFNESALSVLYLSKKEEDLSESQESNKNYLKEQLMELEHSFHFTQNNTLEEAVQSFVTSHETQMITMMAKNLNFFQHILFHPLAKKISYHKEIPFLVLHE
ncbi:Nucleotide-binding universal stress protein, UspA family [Mesonia phycicola]|uniref:Nucleotide-binding universal stress protein, UspA family n=1 Tax=Mesonia phycicola TaxID=579105 RepID=A0A1M6FCF2_9FLAO|nr:universal stress protein [Mesonia phycicola]SHI95400.1 Nucleotide-binding universal stress protein, UspA family [Mesonia phycicola]